jgi:hypothetical protein
MRLSEHVKGPRKLALEVYKALKFEGVSNSFVYVSL